MRKTFPLIILILLFSINFGYAWGDKGHALIAKKAVQLLPEEMTAFKKWESYIEQHATDPDERKKEDKNEGSRHYIDIDFYEEFRDANMIPNKDELIQKYGDSTVTKMGLLPWATFDTYKNLIQAFKDRNRDRILIYASDLAHYIADGHQPMHTILNYDGQLTGQKGAHARYEIHMIDKYFSELEKSFYPQNIFYIDKPLDYIFFYITTANLVSESILASDREAFKQSGSRESDDFYRILWFRTKYITVLQVNNAAVALASFIYSAWLDAGQPELNDLG